MKLSVIIATAFREEPLRKTFSHIRGQTRLPFEVVIVDGEPAPGVQKFIENESSTPVFNLKYLRWNPPSAAIQRNEGMKIATGDILLFLDDDAYPDKDCFSKIMTVFEQDKENEIGGVGALLSNQHSAPPSPRAKKYFDFLADEIKADYSGCVIGPAVNILPQNTQDGSVKQVEWLNSTCTAYRREAFIEELFNENFTGYSFMEDVDLSTRIARKWKLCVHTGAQAYHDYRESRFKKPFNKTRMSIVNRYYVMTETLNRRTLKHHFKFLVLITVSQVIQLAHINSPGSLMTSFKECLGAIVGLVEIIPAAFINLLFKR